MFSDCGAGELPNFHAHQLLDVLVDPEPVKKTDLKFERGAPSKGVPLPMKWELDYVEPWDNWDRIVHMTILDPKNPNNSKKVEFKQRITQLTHDYIKIESERYDWPCYYKTKEVSPGLLRKFLYQYYARQKESDKKDKDVDFRLAPFLPRMMSLSKSSSAAKRIIEASHGLAERVSSAPQETPAAVT